MKGKGSIEPGRARVDETDAWGEKKRRKYESVDEGKGRQLRQRAAGIKFVWVNDPRPEAEAFPLSETPTSRSTRSIAPDTFKASHRRLECFLKYPLLPSLSSPTPRQLNPGCPRICLALVSSIHLQFTDHIFRIFDRSVCSRLWRQDLDASSKTFASINGTAINPSSESPCRKRALLVSSCPGNDESSADVDALMPSPLR